MPTSKAFKMIANTAAQPHDPNAPSFITTLPAEIRNAIYEILFKRDEPVLVHNVTAYHAQEPDSAWYNDPEDFSSDMQLFDQIYESDIGAAPEFDSQFQLGFGIL